MWESNQGPSDYNPILRPGKEIPWVLRMAALKLSVCRPTPTGVSPKGLSLVKVISISIVVNRMV
jgi:hypothetical protein